MFNWVTDPASWLALPTLTILEIILGIDNIIFLSLVVARLPKNQQNSARHLGLIAAMLMRLMLLASVSWMTRLATPLFSILQHPFSIRDLILFFGGVFLLWKASTQIHQSVKGREKAYQSHPHSFTGAISQIMLLDIIFSLDSVFTAVGLTKYLTVMMAAVVISVTMMMFAAKIIGEFVNSHLSIKMLALAFLVLVGFTLILESFSVHIPKGYIYFAMFFSLAVESLNLLRDKKNGV